MRTINYKKVLKYLVLLPVILVVAALLYLMLLLGESDEATSTNILPKQTRLSQSVRNLSLQNASFDEILQEFDGAMLVKPVVPESFELSQSGSKNDYIYGLRAIYRLPDGQPYTIFAQRPISAMQSRNMDGLTLKAEKNIQFAGMIGVWLEDKNGVYIAANSETASYFIHFPLLHENEILSELSTLSLNK